MPDSSFALSGHVAAALWILVVLAVLLLGAAVVAVRELQHIRKLADGTVRPANTRTPERN